MPVYNEKETAAEAIERALAVDLNGIDLEVIVVDDGSEDGTSEIIQAYEAIENVKIIKHEENLGKGAAIRSALPHVTGTLVTVEDADLELDPNEYPLLLEPITNGDADVVFGSRFRGSVENMRWLNRIANRVLSFLASLLYLKKVTDEATCYKVFRTEVIRAFDLQCTGFEFCPEVTAKALRNGYRYAEVPITYRGRSVHGGKKIRAWDAILAIYTLVKYRFRR